MNGRIVVRVGMAVGMLAALFNCSKEVVTPVTVTRVMVEPGQAVVPRGDDLQFTATVFDELDESLHQVAVVWSSEMPQVVSVAPDGTARALAAGSSLVKASFNEVSGSALVTVLPSPDCLPSTERKKKNHGDDDDDDDDGNDDDDANDPSCAPER